MENEKRLTDKDKILLSAIAEFVKENGYPPSVRELCRITGKSSTGTIQARIKSLKQKGYISTTDNGKRTIRITNTIKDVPTVETVEVVHAYWTGSRFNPMTDEYEEYCSHCCAWSSEYGKPYCPNCGAKMDGDGNV